MNSTTRPCIIVPLGSDAHHLAEQFAVEQATSQKGKRVYLNTLAAYAVHSYLRWLQIETDLQQSDRWQISQQVILNAIALLLPNVGKLECCPVLPAETRFRISPVLDNRIGSVGVQFGDRLDTAELLGFVPSLNISPESEYLSIADLQPLDTLLDSIGDCTTEATTVAPAKPLVNLSRWLENSIDAGWQRLEDLFNPQTNPVFSIRSGTDAQSDRPTAGISRGKVLNLAMQFEENAIALIVTLQPSTIAIEQTILVRLYPTGRQLYLPPNLQLAVLDATGEICLETTARTGDNWIQLAFDGEPGERFTIRVMLGDNSITENFAI